MKSGRHPAGNFCETSSHESVLVERCQNRPALDEKDALAARTWQYLDQNHVDLALSTDLAAVLSANPKSAPLHNALGLVTARNSQGSGPPTPATIQAAAGYFQRAIDADPAHAIAGLNFVECLVALDQRQPATDLARRMLELLDRLPSLPPEVLDSGHYPNAFDHFRVEWERAAWTNAGDPKAEKNAKRQLIRWRLHVLLADLTGELHHYYEAALARPDLAMTQAMLGCALARAGRHSEAVFHLQRAIEDNPLDLVGARAYFQVLADTKQGLEQRRFARKRRLLAKAAPKLVPAEDWFANSSPVGDELASIIILCCDQLEFTQKCLDSIFRHTRHAYELILVDNGSNDQTPAFLEEIRQRRGPSRVHVIRNETNLGFPIGCNQGLAHAKGSYIVFLNNDVIVTEGWLEGLIRWTQHDWPNVGLVGAVTNYARPPQQISVNYNDIAGLDAFAARRRQEFAKQAAKAERLSGFCLLARKDVLDKIGGYDECFGLGFFDDDDICVKAIQAGYQLLAAQDVFIHHFGSRTFAGLGIDCKQQLQSNFKLFQDKWGPEHTSCYRLDESFTEPAPPNASIGNEPVPLPESSSTLFDEDEIAAEVARAVVSNIADDDKAATSKANVSLCMIVKNEEDNLTDCLGPVAGLFDEIVVVDTGSTDRTKELAVQMGAKVFDFPWVDSFAAARNESLKHVTGNWVFWLDADDRLDEQNCQKLRDLMANLPNEGVICYSMKCACLPDPIHGSVTVVDHIRLFPSHPDIRWKYRVHEQILPSIRKLGGEVRWSDVTIQHVGYQDPDLRGRKLERDLRLLYMEDKEQPDDPFTLFNIGSVYHEMGRTSEALPPLRRSLERSQPGDSIVRKLYALITQCHRRLDQHAEALTACKEGRRFYPQDVELLFQESLLNQRQGNLRAAETCLLQLINNQDNAHFASVDASIKCKARHNLAGVYLNQNRDAEAEAQWNALLEEDANFVSGWLGLAEPDIATVEKTLAENVGAIIEAKILRARVKLAHREFSEARELLAQVIAERPNAVLPRRVLTHVLLQEGKDWQAAEKALRDLLAIAPNETEAQKNLAVLMREKHR